MRSTNSQLSVCTGRRQREEYKQMVRAHSEITVDTSWKKARELVNGERVWWTAQESLYTDPACSLKMIRDIMPLTIGWRESTCMRTFSTIWKRNSGYVVVCVHGVCS